MARLRFMVVMVNGIKLDYGTYLRRNLSNNDGLACIRW